MNKYGYVVDAGTYNEGKDFSSKMTKTHNDGRPSPSQLRRWIWAKEIAMLQRSDKGKQVREYFIACEKQLKLFKIQKSGRGFYSPA